MKIRTAIALAMGLAALPGASPRAQTLEYTIYMNGEVLPVLGPIVVHDNDGDDTNLGISVLGAHFTASNGVMSVTGDIEAEGVPFGRRVRVHDVTATVPPNQIQEPAGRIDVVACYHLAHVALVAPNIFNSHLHGFFSNTSPAGLIHLTQIKYTPDRNACDSRAFPYTYSYTALGDVPGPVPFFRNINHGTFNDPVTALGATLHFVVYRQGDTIFLATTSAAAEALTLPVRSVQDVPTDFGDNDLGLVNFANGSELDVARVALQDSVLHLFLAGNMESNFNKLEIFIDSAQGGQNRLLGNNSSVDFDALNRMGDSGGGDGLRFDGGFEPDYWIGLTGGDLVPGSYELYANYAELWTSGGGPGYYLGKTTAGGDGALVEGTNPHGIRASIDNSNTAGVGLGCGAASPGGVGTGIYLAIPIAALGYAPGPIRICAFVNGSAHDYVSNQVLGPLPVGTCNLGEPRLVDLGAIPGDQFFELGPDLPVDVEGGPATGARRSAWPNPSRGTIYFRIDSKTEILAAEIFDIAGRRVRSLPRPSNRGTMTAWDGLAQDGTPVAAGVYFVRLRGPKSETTVRVLRLR